jgi:hypothetical protein
VLPPTRFPVARTRPGYATLPWRRGWDSNPRRLITSPLFESGTFNHSDTSPTREVYQRSRAIRRRNGGRNSKTARQLPGGLSWYAWQDSNLRPLGPQPNALSPELQARNAHFTPDRQRPAAAGLQGREGRDSNPRSAFSALNRLAGGPIRPLWHLPRWLCPRLANGVACTGFQTGKFTTGLAWSRESAARQAGVRRHPEVDPPPRWPCDTGGHRVAAPASGGGTRSRDACS